MNLRRVAATVRTIPVVRRVIPIAYRALRTAKRLPLAGPMIVRVTSPAPPPPPPPAAPAPPPRPKPVANLRAARWRRDGVLELSGWAYLPDEPSEGLEVVVCAESPAGRRLAFKMDHTPVDEANLVAKDPEHDRREAAFTARLDLAARADTFPAVSFEQSWVVTVVLRRRESGDEVVRTPFTTYFKLGSAHLFQAENIGADLLVRPGWRAATGLVLVLTRRAARLTDVELSDGRLRFGVSTRRFPLDHIQVKRDAAPPLRLAPVDEPVDGRARTDRGRFELNLADLDLAVGTSAYLCVANPAGSTRHVHWTGPCRTRLLVDATHPDLRIICPSSGVVRIDRTPALLEGTGCSVERGDTGPELVLTGRSTGLAELRLELRGPRDALSPSAIEIDPGEPVRSFVARFPLSVRHQRQRGANAIRQGLYRLVAVGADGEVLTEAIAATELAEQLPLRTPLETLNLRVERSTAGRLQFRVEAPKLDAEHGAVNQARHIATFRSSDHEVVECVYYESFNGRSVGDNTLAIARELSARRPDLPQYWAVADRSVEIPDSATPLLIHSARWWDLLASARYVVTNNWLAGASVRRPYQTVLQAWHGTPLKTLGIDRFEADEPAKVVRMREMTSIWDMLLSQNPYSTDIFRRCYVYDGPVLEVGYPRNDVLSAGLPDADLADLRAELGIVAGQRVVLYMPTWREDTKQLFAELDHDDLVHRLGGEWSLLVRGHTNTQKHGRTVSGSSVVDVTMYPDPAALYLLADVLITDYSSVMFDYSITGKPMIFFTPDLEQYETSLRGTYFSLPRKAPGPLVKTTEEVAEAMLALDDVRSRYAARYARWRADFNPWDDGRAAVRTVDALLEHRPGRA